MLIGIDESNGLIYEGKSDHGGRLLWPSPLVTPLTFFQHSDVEIKASVDANGADVLHYFREDYFDPVSRIRRGRVYKRSDVGQPTTWKVMPHPHAHSSPSDLDDRSGLEARRLYSYDSYFFSRVCDDIDLNSTMLVLGAGEAFSVWSIVGVERVASNEDLITLKARQSFGVLPEIDWDKVPEPFRAKVQETIETLLNDVHRAGPESVIDRCRDVASAMLRAYLGDEHKGKDLGQLIKILRNKQKEDLKHIVISASDIIKIFHPRAKPNEQENYNMRPIREQDAELAVQCVGTILCELGWVE